MDTYLYVIEPEEGIWGRHFVRLLPDAGQLEVRYAKSAYQIWQTVPEDEVADPFCRLVEIIGPGQATEIRTVRQNHLPQQVLEELVREIDQRITDQNEEIARRRAGKARGETTLRAVGTRALQAMAGTLLLVWAFWMYRGITRQPLPRYFWWIAAVAVLVSALASAFGEWWQQRQQ